MSDFLNMILKIGIDFQIYCYSYEVLNIACAKIKNNLFNILFWLQRYRVDF